MTPRSFLTHVCALAAGAMFAAPALAQNALDEIVAKKSITIAIPTDSAPYGYVGTDLQPQGLDIDMAAENCNIQPGDIVAVWGCGPVGQFAIRSAFMFIATAYIAPVALMAMYSFSATWRSSEWSCAR